MVSSRFLSLPRCEFVCRRHRQKKIDSDAIKSTFDATDSETDNESERVLARAIVGYQCVIWREGSEGVFLVHTVHNVN